MRDIDKVEVGVCGGAANLGYRAGVKMRCIRGLEDTIKVERHFCVTCFSFSCFSNEHYFFIFKELIFLNKKLLKVLINET